MNDERARLWIFLFVIAYMFFVIPAFLIGSCAGWFGVNVMRASGCG